MQKLRPGGDPDNEADWEEFDCGAVVVAPQWPTTPLGWTGADASRVTDPAGDEVSEAPDPDDPTIPYWHRQDEDDTRTPRYMYRSRIGLIPPDKVLHHVCDNRYCLNPSHMRIVDMRVLPPSCARCGRSLTGDSETGADGISRYHIDCWRIAIHEGEG